MLCLLLFFLALASHAVTAIGTLKAHYLAPFAPALILILIQGLRLLKVTMRSVSSLGCIATQALLTLILYDFVHAAIVYPSTEKTYADVYGQKQAIVSALPPTDARHLIFVHYQPDHDYLQEWVYNPADIDASPVVWAREMSREEDAALRSYFSDRRCWVVFADEIPPRLESCTNP
jgi:hypothetical protein